MAKAVPLSTKAGSIFPKTCCLSLGASPPGPDLRALGTSPLSGGVLGSLVFLFFHFMHDLFVKLRVGVVRGKLNGRVTYITIASSDWLGELKKPPVPFNLELSVPFFFSEILSKKLLDSGDSTNILDLHGWQ